LTTLIITTGIYLLVMFLYGEMRFDAGWKTAVIEMATMGDDGNEV